MTLTPKGYEPVIAVAQAVEDEIFRALRTNTQYRAAFKALGGQQALRWTYFASHAYVVHAAHHLLIRVFALHPKEGLCELDVGNAALPLNDAGIWGASAKPNVMLDRFQSRFASVFLSGLWQPVLVERILSGDRPPKDPGWTGWTYGKTRPEGFYTLLRTTDAKRLRATLGSARRAPIGRPRKREKAIAQYDTLYPDGHEAARVTMKAAARDCGVSPKTLKRALSGKDGAK